MIETRTVKFNGGYLELWLAVVEQAVNDYRSYPDMRSEIIRFFKSKYFEEMSGVSGKVVLDRLKKENNKNG